MEHPDIVGRLREIITEARKVAASAEGALRYVESGKLQEACDEMSLGAGYPLGRLPAEYDGVMEAFEQFGIEPGKQSKAP